MPAIPSAEFNSLLQSIFKSNSSKRIAIAVSGGPDSIALLHLLAASELATNRLIALTIEHGFRLESRMESRMVASFSEKIGVKHETLVIPWSSPPFPSFPTNHEKTEAPARQSRLILFNRYLKEHDIDSIWMGHHLDDQVENRLIWGKGMKLISQLPKPDGFQTPSKSYQVIRPLLSFTKSQLVATCDANFLTYSIDSSNLDPTHAPRNTLRNQIQQFQSRHSLHPNYISSQSISGPLALLYHSVKTQSLIPPPKPISIGRTKSLTFQVIPSSVPPSTAPALIRASIKIALDRITPIGITRISPTAIELIRQKLWSGNNLEKDFNPGGGVWLSRSLEKGTEGKGRILWTISRQRFRSFELKGRRGLVIGGDWIHWDGRLFVRIERTAVVASDEGRKWFIEGRGKYCEPVIGFKGSKVEEKDQILWHLEDTNESLAGQAEFSWEGNGLKIYYKFNSHLSYLSAATCEFCNACGSITLIN